MKSPSSSVGGEEIPDDWLDDIDQWDNEDKAPASKKIKRSLADFS